MSFLSKALQSFSNFNLEDPSSPLVPESFAEELFGGRGSDAGVTVNEKTAITLSAVYSAIKAISEDLASLPLVTYSVGPDGSLTPAKDKAIYGILHDAPNEFQTASTFRGALLANCLSHGAGFALIKRDKAARVVSLHILSSSKTAPVMREGKLMFASTQTDTGAATLIDPENVLHIVGTTLDGITGLSPITCCKNAIGVSLAAESYAASYWKNSSRASGVFTVPGTLDVESYERLKRAVETQASGKNAHKPLLLEAGTSWTQTSISNVDAAFIESRSFQIQEIARLFRLPLHMLQSLERSTHSNIEQQAIEYRVFTLTPWAVRIEQEFSRKLLPTNSTLTIEHDFAALVRADFTALTAGMNILRNTGAYSANDILKQLRMNPLPAAEGGDLHLAPVNYISLSRLTDPNYVPAGEMGRPTTK
jgi:HK97 family phage portal protein